METGQDQEATPAMIRLSLTGPASGRLEVRVGSPNLPEAGDFAIFVVSGTGLSGGSAVVPFGWDVQGSTVFLPFRADRICWLRAGSGATEKKEQGWDRTRWSDPQPADFIAELSGGSWRLEFPLPKESRPFRTLVYVKAMAANHGWGRLIASSDPVHGDGGPESPEAGLGDRYLSRCWELERRTEKEPPRLRIRSRHSGERARLYQLFPRLFGNVKQGGVPNGTLEENGVGKFNDINEAALASLRGMGFTHLWLTGVLQQATGTDYSALGLPADDPDLLKGIAGSPYAIRDPFDLCPDYAEDPARRFAGFRALLARIHASGMKAIIDLVPNHLARGHRSRVKPEQEFGARGQGGAGDDPGQFFDPGNNFFYLRPDGDGPPLRLPTVDENGLPLSPTCQVLGTCDGRFADEREIGRVTGNNVASWRPGMNDWYETVKLNYGFDFTTGQAQYPNWHAPEKPLPDTWLKMDALIAHWQEQGVDGFRCDMAHLVPPEFWGWALARARERDPEAFFIAEAYDADPAGVPSQNPVLSRLCGGGGSMAINLLDAGFDAVYDDPCYKALKRIYDGPAWANDLDSVLDDPFLCPTALRYVENHDEVRLAAAQCQAHEWGGIGMEVGRPVSALLYGLSRGPVLLYNGQEVGEAGSQPAGFGGHDGRTTLFDYATMPELAKWVNGHAYDGGGLSADQRALRAFYGRLLRLLDEPAFRDGELFRLNAANNQSRNFGRLPGEPASGHWMVAFLRYDKTSRQRFLVAVNLHRGEAFRDVQILLPPPALRWLDLDAGPDSRLLLTDRLALSLPLKLAMPAGEIILPVIPPLAAYYFELTPAPLPAR